MERLRSALQAYHTNTLQVIADTLGVEKKKPVRKKDLVDDLYRVIPTLAGSASFINGLSIQEQVVLKQMLKLDRVCTHRDIAIPLIIRGIVYIRGLEATMEFPSIDSILFSLLSKGLIINLTEPAHPSDSRQFEPLYHFAIPPEVHLKLTLQLPPPEEISLSTDLIRTVEPAIISAGQPEEFIRRLFFTWSELRSKPARLLKSGDIGKRDQRRIAASLGWADDESLPRVQLLYDMLKALKLVYVRDNTAGAEDNQAVTLFWNTSPVGQVREIVRAYPELDSPLDYDTKPLSAFAYYGELNTHPHSILRRKILEVLMHLPIESWVPYPLFYAFVSATTPGYLMLPLDTLQVLSYNLRWYGEYRKAELQELLYTIEQKIVLSVLDELQMLGLIDMGKGPQQNLPPDVLRVSGLLGAHLTQQPWPEPKEQGQVILQPDAQLLAMGPVPMRVLANLERVAVRERHDQGVITYRVTREGIYQALQRGETLAEIQGYLEDATGQPLPQNIARSLAEWAEQHERIVVRRNVQIIQAVSRDVLESLLQDPVISRYLHRLDDKTAWIHKKDVTALEKRLQIREMLPAHSRGREMDLENSLRWDGERLISRSPLPSIFVIGTMHLFAEEAASDDAQYCWKLTSESVKHALATGINILELIRTLETMTGTPLSSKWDKELKAWGKYYGDGNTAQVRLVCLENKTSLQELRLKDRNLHQWLQPLPQTEGLAIVQEVNWGETLALLASYGILVKEEGWW
jgi:hypothetical protein